MHHPNTESSKVRSASITVAPSARWIGGLGLLFAMVPVMRPAYAVEIANTACMECHGDAEIWDMDSAEEASRWVNPEGYAGSVHGDLLCVDCHDSIEDPDHDTPLPRPDCAACHDEEASEYASSIHGMPGEGEPEGRASCASCHGVHDVLPAADPRSRVSHQNLAATCIQCHEDQALIDTFHLPESETIDSYVFSVHGVASEEDPDSKAATCNDCHGWHTIRSIDSPESRVHRTNVATTCARCHPDVAEQYYQSAHGDMARQGNPDVPVCTDCHGEHTITSPDRRESTVSRFHIAETCGRCHEDPEIVSKYNIPIASPTTLYRNSVHGKSLLSGENEDAAACQDCHGYHLILGGQDPRSTVARLNVPGTCGACHFHEQDVAAYKTSVHYTALLQGVNEAPVCSDCHGEHTILSHLDPESPSYGTRLAREVCGRCHDSVVLNRKYGLPGEQVSTYLESYHGLASRLGDASVANCASCHDSHAVLPSSDPRSSVNPDNLTVTCGKCHPAASPTFVSGLIHVAPDTSRIVVLSWVRNIYLVLILFTIGSMVLHNLLIIFRHLRDKYRLQKRVAHVIRFPGAILIQHLILSVTFILLALSGFALKYPDSLMAQAATLLGMTEGNRGGVHRIAGVGLVACSVFHAVYILFTRRGRYEIRSMAMGPADARDLVRNVSFNLGLAKKPPRFGRFDYSEKMEYWALIWGTIVMALTGVLMWFPAHAAQFGFSKIWVDVATAIHFYEAWLATLAIVVWHFFFVMFHPEEYPMALSWLTGRLSVESMRERHPLELEEMEARGEIIAGAKVPADEAAP